MGKYYQVEYMFRTHTCGQLSEKDAGKTTTLSGWVNSRRDHGGLIFIDLRDRYGITQVTFDPKVDKEAWKVADSIRDEYVVRIEGRIIKRPKDMINKKLTTGSIEVEATAIEILSKSKTPPFEVAWVPEHDGEQKIVNEELRLKYRYLDIRGKKMLKNLRLRDSFVTEIRAYLHKEDFIEIDTPILTKSSPEGARDFLVPSRLHPGKFYALPQSPQQYKQLLMIGGIDKYFQIAPCMRDEDARADRSPGEFYQLDLEMSFVEQDDILKLMEKLFTTVVEKVSNKKIMTKPWPRLEYDDVMLRYGSDKPDIRFGLEIQDVSELVKLSGFSVFTDAIKKGGVVRCINAKNSSTFSRGDIDSLTKFVKEFGAMGLAYIVIEKDGSLKSPITKFLGEDVASALVKVMNGKKGDILFFCADKEQVVCDALGNLRKELGKRLELIDGDLLAFCFIVGWPLFENELEDGHYAPAHHMFTMPVEDDIKKLEKDPANVRSLQHDMVLNGFEVGGGSIRIHKADIQEKIFKLIGFKKEKIKFFSHMLEAFSYGAPPHGGMAPGIDRMVMLLAGEGNIREVVAFPKNQKAEDLVIGAPDTIEEQQLKELKLRQIKD